MGLPEKTVERLSAYRRTLINWGNTGRMYIFSHELAAIHNLTAVQVRRDIMLVGYTGQLRKGYHVIELNEKINSILDSDKPRNIAVFGVGDLGRALTGYFMGKRQKLNIAAVFDVDDIKVGKVVSGVRCYHMSELKQVVKELEISIAIVTVPPLEAEKVTKLAIQAGIKGIMNYTTMPLIVPSGVFLEEYDMITSVEKLAYFVKQHE